MGFARPADWSVSINFNFNFNFNLSVAVKDIFCEYLLLIETYSTSAVLFWFAVLIIICRKQDVNEIINLIEALAKKVSTDPSNTLGGDLGWYIPRDKNSAFANAVKSTAVGTYTQTPIKTKSGWGIILIEKVRDLPAYEKEDVYPKITKIIIQQRVAQYLTDLNKAATIKMLEINGKEINFKAQ